MNILQACSDPKVFGQHLRSPTWGAWYVFLAALFALPMTPEQLATYTKHTGRATPPTTPMPEAWLVCGRRAGKSFVLALIATYLACFKDWRPFLGPGETATVMLVAAGRKQARVIKRYIAGVLKAVPMLAQLITNETRESISLRNRVVIEIHTASYKTTRGYSIVAALLDEVAYWPTDETATDPDVEIINAIRPAMATIPDAILLAASSPHARRGALWEMHRKHYGRDDAPVLVWQADTRSMNASVPQSLIDAALEADPPRASAEWLAQFRSDVEGFVRREVAQACVSEGVYERPRETGVSYVAFADPSAGSVDSMTLAIAHAVRSKQVIVVDALREVKAPFSPDAVVDEFAALLKTYNLSSITGDRVGGQWCIEQFAKFGVRYAPAAKVKSELYADLLALLNSKRIDLLDNQRTFNQLVSLERRTSRSGGRDQIDHPPGQHDDLINAVAGVASLLLARSTYNLDALSDTLPDDPTSIDEYRARRRDSEQHRAALLQRFGQPARLS